MVMGLALARAADRGPRLEPRRAARERRAWRPAARPRWPLSAPPQALCRAVAATRAPATRCPFHWTKTRVSSSSSSKYLWVEGPGDAFDGHRDARPRDHELLAPQEVHPVI